MHLYLKQVATDSDLEPQPKRQKVDSKEEKYATICHSSRFLQKQGVLAVGLKETLKLLQAQMGKSADVLVFVLHDKEHESTNS